MFNSDFVTKLLTDLYIFNLIFLNINTPLYILRLCKIMFHDLLIKIWLYLSISEILLAIRDYVD